jgi:hypothetical protein
MVCAILTYSSLSFSATERRKEYVFEITSAPIALRYLTMVGHKMSRREIKFAAVELVERFGR